MDDSEYFAPLRLPFKLLKISGFWQDKSASKLYKVFGIFVHLIAVELFVLCQLIYFFNSSSLIDLSDVLSVLFIFIAFGAKSINFVVKFDEIADLMDDLKDLISFSASSNEPFRPLILEVKNAHQISRVFLSSCVATTFLGGLGPFIIWILNPNPLYKIAYKMWTPFDYENNVFWIFSAAVYQLVNTMFSSAIFSALDLLPIYIFSVGAGLLEELGARLTRIGKDSKCDGINEKVW